MMLHSLFKYQSNGYPNATVVGVQFLAHSGIALADYGLVPMRLENMVRVSQKSSWL